MLALLAQAAPAGAFTLAQLLIWVIVIAAIVSIAWVALRAMKVSLPQWFVTILMILAVAVVAILAIKFLLSL